MVTDEQILKALLRKLASGGTPPSYSSYVIVADPAHSQWIVTLDGEEYIVTKAEIDFAPASIADPGPPVNVQGTNIVVDEDSR